jgi:hypothetical protein
MSAGRSELESRLAELRAKLAAAAGANDDGEAAEVVREAYGELLEEYRGDADATSRIRDVGHLIEEAVQRGELPQALIRRRS